MGEIINLGIGGLLGTAIYIFVNNISNICNSQLGLDEKKQRNFIINFVSGMGLIFLTFTIFKSNKSLRNNAVRYGLGFGGVGLAINSLIINWKVLDEYTKTILIGICMLLIIWYAYKNKRKKIEEDEEDGEEGEDEK